MLSKSPISLSPPLRFSAFIMISSISYQVVLAVLHRFLRHFWFRVSCVSFLRTRCYQTRLHRPCLASIHFRNRLLKMSLVGFCFHFLTFLTFSFSTPLTPFSSRVMVFSRLWERLRDLRTFKRFSFSPFSKIPPFPAFSLLLDRHLLIFKICSFSWFSFGSLLLLRLFISIPFGVGLLEILELPFSSRIFPGKFSGSLLLLRDFFLVSPFSGSRLLLLDFSGIFSLSSGIFWTNSAPLGVPFSMGDLRSLLPERLRIFIGFKSPLSSPFSLIFGDGLREISEISFSFSLGSLLFDRLLDLDLVLLFIGFRRFSGFNSRFTIWANWFGIWVFAAGSCWFSIEASREISEGFGEFLGFSSNFTDFGDLSLISIERGKFSLIIDWIGVFLSFSSVLLTSILALGEISSSLLTYLS